MYRRGTTRSPSYAMCKNAVAVMILLVDSLGDLMKRFVEGVDRDQAVLFPECLEDWVDQNNAVRVIEAFVEALDLGDLGFGDVDPKATGRPAHHPSVLSRLTAPSSRL